MKPLVPYLFFNGNCRDAMGFYRQCFGGKLELVTYGDAPDPGSASPADKDKIMHACLTQGDFCLMASDNCQGVPVMGDSVSISVHPETVAETDKLFAALSDGGKVTMPLADMFWGAYFGMLVDRFGFQWMLNCKK